MLFYSILALQSDIKIMKEVRCCSLDIGKLKVENIDCLKGLKLLGDNSVDLVFTSPPYAEQRKGKYDSINTDSYIEWFLPIVKEISRVIKKEGSFFLNLAPHAEEGERSLYVMELVVEIRKQTNFKFIDEIVWYKSANPRKWDYRLKSAWEPIYHFSLGKPYVNHENMKIPTESAFINKRGYSTYAEITGNVGGHHEIADQGSGFTLPDNVLYFPTSLLVKDKYPHPAKFPVEMAELFVRGYCPKGGTVLDPFMGSGTVGLASLLYNRNCIGYETFADFVDMAYDRVRNYKPQKQGIPKGTKMFPIDIFEQ